MGRDQSGQAQSPGTRSHTMRREGQMTHRKPNAKGKEPYNQQAGNKKEDAMDRWSTSKNCALPVLTQSSTFAKS